MSFTSVRHCQRRRTWLPHTIEPHVLEDARNDAGLGNDSNHTQLSATMRAALQVDGEYALEPGHPAERRNSNIGRAFIVPGDFTGYLGAGHDVGSLVGIGREHPVVAHQMGFGAW